MNEWPLIGESVSGCGGVQMFAGNIFDLGAPGVRFRLESRAQFFSICDSIGWYLWWRLCWHECDIDMKFCDNDDNGFFLKQYGYDDRGKYQQDGIIFVFIIIILFIMMSTRSRSTILIELCSIVYCTC